MDAVSVLVEADFAFGQGEECSVSAGAHVVAGDKPGPPLADDDATGADERPAIRLDA